MKSYLYILKYPELDAFKIGKADDVESRVKKLNLTWGELDAEESYSILLPLKHILKIEKALHTFLMTYSKNVGEGDGKTEFFELEILEKALHLIKEFLEINPDIGVLKKGLCLTRVKGSTQRSLIRTKWKPMVRENKSLQLNLKENAQALRKILGMLTLLEKYKDEIAYEFDLTKPYGALKIIDKKVFQYFKRNWLKINSGFSRYNGGYNFLIGCEFGSCEKEIVISLNTGVEGEDIYFKSIMDFINRLPKVSPANKAYNLV